MADSRAFDHDRAIQAEFDGVVGGWEAALLRGELTDAEFVARVEAVNAQIAADWQDYGGFGPPEYLGNPDLSRFLRGSEGE